jgi:hypothetical protein
LPALNGFVIRQGGGETWASLRENPKSGHMRPHDAGLKSRSLPIFRPIRTNDPTVNGN